MSKWGTTPSCEKQSRFESRGKVSSVTVSSFLPDVAVSRHSERLVQYRKLSCGWQLCSSQKFKAISQSVMGLELVRHEGLEKGEESFPPLPVKHNLVQAWANYSQGLCCRCSVAKLRDFFFSCTSSKSVIKQLYLVKFFCALGVI